MDTRNSLPFPGVDMQNISIMIVSEGDRGDALRNSLASDHHGVDVVSSVTTRETAIKQLSVKPDIVLLDPDVLKQRAVSSFVRSVQEKSPLSRVLLVYEDTVPDDVMVADIKAGVGGYVRASDPPEIIARAGKVVKDGEIWAERRILTKAIAHPLLFPLQLSPPLTGLAPLTNREKEMLTMVLQGATNREIAKTSSISERTVKTHLYRIYKKLNVKSRAKAMALLSHP